MFNKMFAIIFKAHQIHVSETHKRFFLKDARLGIWGWHFFFPAFNFLLVFACGAGSGSGLSLLFRG